MTSPVLQFKRGAFANLPGLRVGEPGFTTDKYDLYIGLSSETATNQFYGSGRYWGREDGTNPLEFKLVDKDGSNSINLRAPATLSGVTTYTFPETPQAGKLLITDASGTLSWGSEFSSDLNITGIVTASGGFNIGINSSGNVITTGPVQNLNFIGAGNTFAYNADTDTVDITIAGEGSAMTLGSPTDGSYTSPAALNTFTSTTKISDSIDDLNELALNIMRNTAVSGLAFTANSTAGGAPFAITLSTGFDGNANSFEIDWGDGSALETTSDSTPSHTYTNTDGGLFSIEMVAKHTGGAGAGHSFSAARSNYITVYTPDPSVSFALYRASSGGSALSGSDLYVVEGQSLYLDNNTTNATQVGSGATYTVDWGDGSANSFISSNTVGGGASTTADRLQHTWADGTLSGTGRDTLTLTINKHDLANPGVIPTSSSVNLKVYDDSPAAPDSLSSKTLSNVSSTGTSPKAAHGFTENTSGAAGISTGDTVNRVTTGTATAGPITSFAYNADSGTLTAMVNGSADGQRVLTGGDDSASYTSLTIDSESDYNLLTSGGTSTTFANSTFYPGLYKGFKARVAKSVSGLSVGTNSMQLQHSTGGNTNTVGFMRDDLTSSPTVDVSSATVTQNNAGTFRYVSGIPYYNSGSPTLTVAGVEIDHLVGQCYTDQNDIVEVDDGDNQEGTSSNAITNSGYTYAQIDGASTMLEGGIPKVNTGTASSYAIGSLTVPITSSSVRTISRVKVRAKNVNGTSSYSSSIATNIQVHTASQSGINETAIAVSDSLGNGDLTNDGVRIFDFSAQTTNTPDYSGFGVSNFYTNSLYSEASDPGVSGTKEATVRLGVIKHDTTNYASGYLPAGPNRSGDTGTQYFTFAFQRKAVANFELSITSSGGISGGVFIAAPGTNIDSASGLNGWLRADQTYAGSGTPGSDTGNGGNGSDGCAFTSGDRIQTGTALSSSYTLTLGDQNMTDADGNVVLVRIGLASGESVTALSVS